MSFWQSSYRVLTSLAEPAVRMLLDWRESRGKEDPDRVHERFGYASHARPEGKLVWVHAASVGEMMSALLLLEKLAAHLPQTHFLITTGTVTSARVLATRLPPRTLHQFVPVDVPACVARFMAHWQPDMALWLESELWPNLLAALRAHRIPTALINARMSKKSQRNWRFALSWITEMLGGFNLCLTQTESGQETLRALGARNVSYVGNLKFAALPLPDDDFGRAKLTKAIGKRPIWLFASSHPGEEEIVIAAQAQLRQEFPDLLAIIVPRHPLRADKIMTLMAQHHVASAQRSKGQPPDAHCSVYVADTLGELGVFYRLSPLVVVGGSFVPVGGHNPIEPALLGAAVGFGPLMPNFSEVVPAMLQQGAATQLPDTSALVTFVRTMLRDTEQRNKQSAAAQTYATAQGAVHDRVIAALQPLIELARLS